MVKSTFARVAIIFPLVEPVASPRFVDLQTYNGHIHSVRVGVGEVAEQEERVVLGQAARVVEIPQLKTDVLHRGSLHRGGETRLKEPREQCREQLWTLSQSEGWMLKPRDEDSS